VTNVETQKDERTIRPKVASLIFALFFLDKKNAKQTLQKTHVFAHLNVNTAAQKISVPQNKKDPSFDFATNGAIRQHRKKNSSSPRCVATDLGARESKSESVPV